MRITRETNYVTSRQSNCQIGFLIREKVLERKTEIQTEKKKELIQR